MSSASAARRNERAEQADPLPLGVKEGYERWAASYDRTPNPVIAREERHLEPLISGMQGKSVLDLACGTGRWLEKVMRKRVRLGVGVDSSDAMLCVARDKHSLQRKLIRADCLRLPFRSAVFDFVICSFALGHIKELPKVVSELARVTKIGGEAIVSDLHPQAYARGWRTGFRDACSSAEIETFPHSREEIIQGFAAGGMECLTCEALCLGDPERPIFATANKQHLFSEVSGVAAVLVCRFKKSSH